MVCLKGPDLDGGARQASCPRGAYGRLRDAPGLLDAGTRGGQSPTDVPRAGSQISRVCPIDGIYPCRIPPDHGASSIRLLGLPDHWLLCPNAALWDANGFYVSY